GVGVSAGVLAVERVVAGAAGAAQRVESAGDLANLVESVEEPETVRRGGLFEPAAVVAVEAPPLAARVALFGHLAIEVVCGDGRGGGARGLRRQAQGVEHVGGPGAVGGLRGDDLTH